MKLTVKQAAARACVSKSLLYALLKSGRLAGVRIGCRGRGTWRVEESVLDAFLEDCKSEPPPEPPLRHIR
jgi:excisionase family DNA binding protein